MQDEKVKKKKRFKWWYILIAVIVIGIIGSALDDSDTPKPVAKDPSASTTQAASTAAAQTTVAAKTTFAIGEGADLNGVVATLVSAETSEGTQFNKPSDGNVFLICEFEIENNSTKEITVSSMLSFNAYADDYAISQSFAGVLAADKPQLDGSVAAGKKMKGAISYEVPTDWKELEIRYTPDYWKGSEIIFVATSGQ